MAVQNLAALVDQVRGFAEKPRVAIAPCAEPFVLGAALEARDKGVAEPVLIGPEEETRKVAADLGANLSDLEFIPENDPARAVDLAVELYKQGRAQLIMKGLVSTSILLRAVLNKRTGVPPKGILSHVGVFEAPLNGRLTLVTDAGVNIEPTLQRKVDITKNALWVARCLGMSPRVAVLAATEKVNYPAMPATLDADLISKMAAQGEFGDALVQGPLSLDLAVSEDAAKLKGVSGPVAGRANVLVVPRIESGNVLYKALSTFNGTTLASVVVGSAVPLVVPSRGDSEASKFNSIALAAYLAVCQE